MRNVDNITNFYNNKYILIDINARDYIDETGIGTSTSTSFISASIYCNSNVIFI